MADPRLGGRTVNEILQDISIRHAIGLERLKRSDIAKLIKLLAKVDADLLDKLEKRLNRLSKLDATNYAIGKVGKSTTDRLEKLREIIQDIEKITIQEGMNFWKSNLQELSKAEAAFQINALKFTVPVDVKWVTPSTDQLHAIVTARPFQGKLLRDYAKRWGANKAQRVDEAIKMGLLEGETIDQIMRRIRGTKARNFKDGILDISRKGAATITRTAVNHTSNRAREKVFEANSDVIKGVQWVSTLDSRTTEICMARDGKVFAINSGPRPPAHYNCLPGDSLVLPIGGISAASKRRFEGDLVTIKTRSGKILRATPNHPVLSSRGWLGSQFLKVGDQVLSHINSERVPPGFKDEDQNVEAPIEDVIAAFSKTIGVVPMEVPTTTPDFHGDGTENEVCIVWSNRRLGSKGVSKVAKQFLELKFKVASSIKAKVVSNRLFSKRLKVRSSACSSLIRRSRVGLLLLWRHAVHAGLLLRRSISKQDVVFFQDATDWGVGNPNDFSDTLNAYAGFVQRDEVVSVDVSDFSGHVYNLETESGTYFANGIITHNCRSITVPVTHAAAFIDKEADQATRSSMNGRVPADQTYDEWLRRQPKEVQEDALGKTKAKLFRDGMKIEKFSDPKSGRTYTLDELRATDIQAFRDAGLM